MEEPLFSYNNTTVTRALVTLHGKSNYAIKAINSVEVSSFTEGSGGPVMGLMGAAGSVGLLVTSLIGGVLTSGPTVVTFWILGGLGVFLMFASVFAGLQRQRKIWTLRIKLNDGQSVTFRDEGKERILAMRDAITQAMSG